MLMRTSLLALVVLLAPAAASADVATPPPPGKEFVTYSVRVDNLAAFKDFVLLVYDTPSDGKLRASLRFVAEGAAEQILVRGGSWRSEARFGRPRFWLLPLAAEKAWSEATNQEIARQREACAERNEGCMHISRFSPSYAPPEGAIDCGVEIEVRASVPKGTAGKDRQVLDVFRLVEATATTCRIERVPQAALPTPSTPGMPKGLVGGVALAGGGAAMLGLLVAGLLVWRGRRAQQV